ncbi:IucA/IucC family protein [Candidatus Nitrotoga sp. M5]|uniref:IucA/IucC family protein n=1 Tax=Candidatus Nitrotoga sp. M5 TaxID=2890409 RepID=UPI001EF189DA|nr:IucA/IucC family protein [Candidatus Nitrotoga sp. M5]CAH1386618.1 putative siderophore biosynthesis protein [Candidatus Nitrotoga sp. M5]
MQITPTHPYALRLTQDLFDALWLENLYDFRTHCAFHLTAEDETVLEITLSPIRSLCWHGYQTTGLRPFRVSDRPAVLHATTHTTDLNVIEAVEALQTADWWIDRTGRFVRFFRLAYDQTAFAAVHEDNIMSRLTAAPDDLLSWEALSCLKDRPFHPLARAKDWDESDGTAYLPETATSFALHWVALPRDRVRGSACSGQPLADILLDHAQQNALAEKARICGADSEVYLWLPVHPWQWEQLSRTVPSEFAACINLGSGPGTVLPTASLRSLAIIGRPGIHVKLALSVNALGAMRTLPPRYLHNGMLASVCLETLRRRDDWLAAHLLLCEENDWWALRQDDVLQNEPGELACLIRRYPALPNVTLIPMAALPVVSANGSLPAFDKLVGPAGHEDEVWNLFADIAHALLELGLRCFAGGVMPELHGQNVVLGFQGQRIVALVLRDHDSLRICSPLMQAQGLAAPDYVFDRSIPNTLELNTPQQLLAYLQTLAIEVNLYAILAALAERYDREETHGWRIVRTVMEDCLARVPLTDEIASQTKSLLLDEPSWPFKQVLGPLLNRPIFGTGMPSSMGKLANPLLPIGAYA